MTSKSHPPDIPRRRRCAHEGCRRLRPQLVLDGAPVFENALCFEHAAESLESEEREQQERWVATLLERAGGSKRMADWSLDTYPTDVRAGRAKTAALEWLDRYREGTRENLLLFGPVGVGKTGLAWGIVRQLCEDGIWAMLVNLRDLLAEIRRSYTHGTDCELIERAGRASVLALDDLGAERPTQWAREELAILVEDRYAQRSPLIVTSNFDPDTLARRLGHDDLVVGQRLVSRICDGAVQVRIAGRDRRAA